MKRTIDLGGRPVALYVSRRRTDCARLRVSSDGAVRVTVPLRGYGAARVDALLSANRAWIDGQLASLRAAERRPSVRILGRDWPVRAETAARPSVCAEGGAIVVRTPAAGDRDAERALLDAWLRGEAARCFQSLADRLYPAVGRLGAARPSISVRAMRTRWGSCNARSARISLSLALFRAPIELAEYVVLHELAHLLHPDHQAGFRAFMAAQMPDWRARRARLHREPTQ